ncbi:MAG TPA: alternative ribosome rescue aminoacyl-tRNA hydrolase ArfB [Rhodanobacteraceae bacterium]|nr:alternative ribosome rescue aminoacyl-tRNA hydrolase ArfB [Rhodanobacteraceae bacterium]
MLRVDVHLAIPESELSETFMRAAGPGGQHVNRTESAVTLRFDVAHSPSLPGPLRARLLARRDRRLTAEGVLVIQARRFRDQARNRQDARQRLAELLLACRTPPKPRLATRPSRAARQRRLDAKQQRGQLKRQRRVPDRSAE